MKLNTERIRLINSMVYRCYSCGTWYVRVPAFDLDCGKGDECLRCGCTSFKNTPGRPYGPKSKEWDNLIKEIKELVEMHYDFGDERDIKECFVLKEQA